MAILRCKEGQTRSPNGCRGKQDHKLHPGEKRHLLRTEKRWNTYELPEKKKGNRLSWGEAEMLFQRRRKKENQ